ncbi:hypothetical protein [Nostoc sp. KVJ20]|uniref:hypothetical protein n=1 Tax=Nostoc sp. KVJ20 TaxID=457944 RepID=UPI00114D37E5|nr:hypothetical protein [Nostoc sp. KVJ20]
MVRYLNLTRARFNNIAQNAIAMTGKLEKSQGILDSTIFIRSGAVTCYAATPNREMFTYSS